MELLRATVRGRLASAASLPLAGTASRRAALARAAFRAASALGRRGREMRDGAPRGIALFLGIFCALNLVGEMRFAGAQLNLWWMDLWPLPAPARRVVLGMMALALASAAVAPAERGWRRTATRVLIGIGVAAALLSAGRYYRLLVGGSVGSPLPLPFSLVVAAALAVAWRAKPAAERRARPWATAACAAAAFVLFPALQTALFGLTDYRRSADLIVVFGAHAYADGTSSPPLEARVRTASALYRAGLAPRLLFSGGPGDGAVDEPHAMRALAMRLGVPADAILLDGAGLDTEQTVRNTVPLAAGGARVLAVSDFYHLPRVKMAFQRQGLDVYTVPARGTPLLAVPYNLLRETAAFWVYYLRHLD